MSKVQYFLIRVAQTIFLLWAVLTLLFIFFRALPGDYASLMLAEGTPESTVEAFREDWGLNDPLYVQYFTYITNLITLDAGTSHVQGRPVWEFVRIRIFNSLILIAPAITLAYIIGAILGTILGNARGTKLEKYGLIPIILLGATPAFVLAIFAVIIFSLWLDLTPAQGMVGVTTRSEYREAAWWRIYFTTDFAHHFILPFTVILLRYLYLPTLIMRTSVVEVTGQDFAFYHRMSGLRERSIMKQLGKHASLPVITMYPVSMTQAVGGLVLVELVFNWPGIGYTLVQAIFARDTPVTQFVFFLIAAFVIIANFVIDFLYGYIDPRVSIGD